MNIGTLGLPRRAALSPHFSRSRGTPRRWIDKARETVSVRDFATRVGVGWDDTATIKKAVRELIRAGGGCLHFPGATYTIVEQIIAACDAQQHLTFRGDGRYQSILDFQRAATLGLKFQSTSAIDNQRPSFEVAGLGLITSHDNCGTALDFDFADADSIDSAFVVRDVFIGQTLDRVSDDGDGFGYWNVAIRANNARVGTIDNLLAWGEIQNVAPSSIGIKFEGESVRHVITNSHVGEFETGVVAGNGCEGLYLSDFDAVFCRHGVRWNVSVGAEPQLTVHGGHFNTTEAGIYCTNVQQSVILGALFYANAVLDDPGPWPNYTGVLFDGADSRHNSVLGCTFSKEIGRTGDTCLGINFAAGSFYNALGNKFFGFNGNQYTTGIAVQNGVTHAAIDPTNHFEFVTAQNSFAAGSQAVRGALSIRGRVSGATTGAVVSFSPHVFTAAPVVTAIHEGVNTAVNAVVSAVTASGFTLNHNAGGAADFMWVAVGAA